MRPVLFKIGTVSNTIIVGLDQINDEEVSLSDFLGQIHNDASNLAELWHELGNIPGAFEPILDDVLTEYLAFERYELKKLIRVYINDAETNSRKIKKWCVKTRQAPKSHTSRESTKEATRHGGKSAI